MRPEDRYAYTSHPVISLNNAWSTVQDGRSLFNTFQVLERTALKYNIPPTNSIVVKNRTHGIDFERNRIFYTVTCDVSAFHNNHIVCVNLLRAKT